MIKTERGKTIIEATLYSCMIKWLILFVVAMTGLSVGLWYITNGWITIYDRSFVSYIIVFLFVYATVTCGWSTMILNKSQFNEDELRNVNRVNDRGWFLSGQSVNLGLVGTVVGFMIIGSGFFGLDMNDKESIERLVKTMGIGVSTALFTTLLGQLSNILLQFQYFNLQQNIDRVVEYEEAQ